MRLLLFCSILVSTLVHASQVSVGLPLEKQLPLIARVDQPYSWAFSPNTFIYMGGSLSYTSTDLPAWLSFDPSTLILHGTPTAEDEGDRKITITASDGTSSAFSSFILCVTSRPGPVLNKPISAQLYADNPSLSSVFLVSPHSAISTENPAVWIPHGWSFSIGIDANTFKSDNRVYYDARQADGSDLPPWMNFDCMTYTLDGVTPHEGDTTVYPIDLIVTDKQGYKAQAARFDVAVTDHEFSLVDSLPTINITAKSPVHISLQSPDDFSGLLVDGKPVRPSDIETLDIDITHCNHWLSYNRTSRVLSGDSTNIDFPLDQRLNLPVTVTTTFNQSIFTNYMIAIVPSYFLKPDLPPLEAKQGVDLSFDLPRYFAEPNSRVTETITASFEPEETAKWLKFDPVTARLTGVVPASFSGQCSVSFTAYSQVTHSVSHALLPIFITPMDGSIDGVDSGNSRKLSAAAKSRFVLPICIVLGCLGTVFALGGCLALVRKCAKVEDPVISGEEGRRAWTSKDRKWYGVASPNIGTEKFQRGYGWTDISARNASEVSVNPKSTSSQNRNYGTVGLGLGPVFRPDRPSPANSALTSGIIRKKDFVSMIKKTARQVSDKCKPHNKNRLLIGKPTLITLDRPEDSCLPYNSSVSQSRSTFSFRSTLTEKRSIPKQRADFAPPKSPKSPSPAHIHDEALSRQHSSSSECSIPQLLQAEAEGSFQTVPLRPRLVPFTSANRVPVPQGMSKDYLAQDTRMTKAKRVPSQKATVWRLGESTPAEGDEICFGLHYIEKLGAAYVPDSLPSVPTVATSYGRSSVSSLESSHQGHGVGGRVIVRAGESFRYRVRVPSLTGTMLYTLKLADGRPIPRFLNHSPNLKNACIELYGIPRAQDIGVLDCGVYTNDGECAARITIDVVGKT
ncbi:hypothetical protein M378DRAFT_8124 [Amanita muscaria Koide BX008]|uniref:Dystroglycan-type cadherin-like domain-containing protein n=1 Tax=Amanita muscaria (strain Koide BX008) TaxID=946122 RepID=A0A0C2XK79_AMAMK|nr:hypothetical protein M378DRAFT_8124 [Amanita muscaria Koide BX008]